MGKVCEVTGKKRCVGNNRSHARNATKRVFLPNVHRRKFWFDDEKRYVKLYVSKKGLKIIDKIGIKAALVLVNKLKKVI